MLVAAIGCAAVGPGHAQAATDSPRLLVHLLSYLASDYPGSVSDGKVIDPTEYREQVEFAHAALAMSRELPDTQGQTDITSGIGTLTELIERKASPAEVSTLALQVTRRVIQVAGVTEAPDRWPSLVHGRELYQRSCVSCHGERGAGDGPAGKLLDPRPADFSSAGVGSDITPFRAFNAIRMGVPGTPMAASPTLSDQDVWDLAFYVTSLHVGPAEPGSAVSADALVLAATQSDRQLMASLPGSEEEKRSRIAALRLHSEPETPIRARDGGSASSLSLARSHLTQAAEAYAARDFAGARHAALLAYLEGIEPVEPRLQATDARFVAELEGAMSAVRSAVERGSDADLRASLSDADRLISEAERRLEEHPSSPWVTFALTAGILLREGFEAVLILIALLAVVRASDAKTAARWIHAGWLAALAVGFVSWFFSGWLVAFSGARRETLEAVTALLAVAVLLYIGFWLHSRTEISRWTLFIEVRVKAALQGSRLWGLATISFMAVFREAFETVLFLRAISLEGGSSQTTAMGAGVAVSLLSILGLSWGLLRYSARVPIRRIFTLSSLLMAALAVILTGKGLHALQETGGLSATPTRWHWTWDLVGVYATWETILAQFMILALVYVLWMAGNRPAARSV